MEDEKKPEAEFNLVVMIEKAGNDAKVKIISHAPIFRDEIAEIMRAIQATLELAAKDREGRTPTGVVTFSTPEEKERLVRTIGKLVEEKGREMETLDRSLEDEGPEEPVMSEDEKVFELAARHGVDAMNVKHFRERVRTMKFERKTTKEAAAKQIADEGELAGVPRNVVFALVEDILET